MSELVPDPFDERLPALLEDENGLRLAPAVFAAPVGTPIEEMRKGRPIGYLKSFD